MKWNKNRKILTVFILLSAVLLIVPAVYAAVANVDIVNNRKKYILNISGKEIAIGEQVKSVEKKLGVPVRKDKTGYDFKYYVYNKNYSDFKMIAIQDNRVAGFYTDAENFEFNGIKQGMDLSTVNKASGQKFSLNKKPLIFQLDNYKVTIFMDELENKKVMGIQVLTDQTEFKSYKGMEAVMEKQILDLTNSIRAKKGIPALLWSEKAAASAKKHSEDMASQDYFSHTNKKGQSPFERMRATGIYYRYAGENIAAGQNTAMAASHGWLNSGSHRKNLLNEKFMYLGVGTAFGGSYGKYYTQNFYQ